MANQKHVDILSQGADAWNKWREQYREAKPNLSGADLSGADLNKTKLSAVNLSRANLSRAYLRRANLKGAKLSGVNLNEAHLIGADLSTANLRGANLSAAKLNVANLSRADLNEANLRGADLRGANLNMANLNRADLSAADLRGAKLNSTILTGATLSSTTFKGADLSGANLSRAISVGTNFTEAILTDCCIYGIAAWDLQLDGATQLNLVITRSDQPTIAVDNLEVAQFVYLLLNHKKLRDVINTVTERGVLILGRFGGVGLEVLQAIATRLREASYLPIIFDFERPQDRNYTETIKTLAGLSRFVIADLSGPSVPQELYATVPHFKIPFVPIIEAGRKPYAMAVDILEYPWVVRPPVTFATTEELLEELPTKVIAPAEEMHQARQKLLDELFNKT